MEIFYSIDSYFVDKKINKIKISGWAFSPSNEEILLTVKGANNVTITWGDRPDVKAHFANSKIKPLTYKNIGWSLELDYSKKIQLEFSIGQVKKIKTINFAFMIMLGRIKKAFYLLSKLTFSNVIKGLKLLRKEGIRGFLKKIKSLGNDTNKKNAVFYNKWLTSNSPSEEDLELQRNKKFDIEPLISVLVPTYNTPAKYLKETLDSVLKQTYSNWELCIADGASSEPETIQMLKEYEEKDSRIKVLFLKENQMISENSNRAAETATGEYIALLDHDDVFMENALFEIVEEINAYPTAEIIYTDEDRMDEKGYRKTPSFKPDWSPDLLYSQMYICHILCFKRSLFEKVGGFRKEFDGSQDYDLLLRMSRETNHIHHVPKVLYSWREISTSTSINPGSKPYAHSAGLNALNDHLNIKYNGTAFAEETDYLFVYNARFPLQEKIKVSIIIPTKDKIDLLNACVESILEKTESIDYEILILNNNSNEKETFEWFEQISRKHDNIRVIDAPYEFNWSKLNNHGIREAKGDVYVFLNNDTIVISEDWLLSLAENAMREEIGTVGALLLYEDETIQHSGVVLGMGGWADHVYKAALPIHYSTPFVSPVINRNVLASTGACLAISKSTIEKIGNFDENFIICGSDVEISLRARKHGYFNLLDAKAKLFHLESKSRDSYIPPIDFEMSKIHYKEYLENGDPYYNKNLNLHRTTPSL